MAISGISGGFSNVSVTVSAQERAQKLLKQMDTDADGSVSKQEFTTFGESVKAPKGASGVAKPSADDLFAKADQDGNGSLSVSDLSAMMAEHETHAAARGGAQRAAGGPPPGGGGGPPPGGGGGPPPGGGTKPGGGGGAGGASAGGGASASSNSSSSSEETDPADSNQDGTVSAAEKLIYEMTHPEVSDSSTSASTSATTT